MFFSLSNKSSFVFFAAFSAFPGHAGAQFLMACSRENLSQISALIKVISVTISVTVTITSKLWEYFWKALSLK